MISKSFIKKLKNEIEKKESQKGKIIRETNSLIREAKNSIFKTHRGQIEEAQISLDKISTSLKNLENNAARAGLRSEATLKAAIEEYLEALFFLRVVKGKSLSEKIPFAAQADEQLGALSDLTGELVRAATLEVTKGHLRCVKMYRDSTEELFGILLQMDLRGSLRQKRDDARRNLKRLEEILYDVSLKFKR